MKANILNIDGKKLKDINLPKCFSADIREDIVAKVLEAKKRQQPYAPSLVAGKQHSASGIIRHRRHVWKTHYGQGISRIPRKIISAKGNRFNWIGAEISSTVGGRRAHPPKVLSMMGIKSINKKELKIALSSALSATANKNKIVKRYQTLEKLDKEFPLIVSNFNKIKIKELLINIKKLLGNELYNLAIKKKSVRAGKGTRRGRKYKSNAGLLIVIGKDEKLKTNAFEVVNVKSLGVTDLARGGLGRLTLYTEQAIKYLEEMK
ncbi:50S ribosomal protein L4 [Candidatus Pacearchaeota archaeon]|nr:50S ribosomal protein L4 [Candidatus Pacearchaeota archaeon]